MKAKPTMHVIGNLEGDSLELMVVDVSQMYAIYSASRIKGVELVHTVNRASRIKRDRDNYGCDDSDTPWERWRE